MDYVVNHRFPRRRPERRRGPPAQRTHAILFGFNSAEITEGSKPVLDAVAGFLRANPTARLEVQGHTDNIGGAAFNLDLSQKRAEAVRAALITGGIDAGRLVAKGYGYTQPIPGQRHPRRPQPQSPRGVPGADQVTG